MEYFLTATIQNSDDITAVFEVRNGGAYSYTARITAATLDDAVSRLTAGQPGAVVLERVSESSPGETIPDFSAIENFAASLA